MSEEKKNEDLTGSIFVPSIVTRAEEFLLRVRLEGVQDYQTAVQHLEEFVNHFRGMNAAAAEIPAAEMAEGESMNAEGTGTAPAETPAPPADSALQEASEATGI